MIHTGRYFNDLVHLLLSAFRGKNYMCIKMSIVDSIFRVPSSSSLKFSIVVSVKWQQITNYHISCPYISSKIVLLYILTLT